MNPANILLIGRNDRDFVVPREPSKVLLLTHSVPAQRSLNPVHGFEERSLHESEIRIARRPKHDVHRYFVKPTALNPASTPGSITK
jgi:hypothetical protein